MPYENKLVFFDLSEVHDLIRNHVNPPPGVSNLYRVIKLVPLLSRSPNQFYQKQPLDKGDIAAIEIIFSDSESLRSFRQIFTSESLIELMVDHLIASKTPIARSFTKRVLTSDFHLCLEMGNLPVQFEGSPQGVALETI